MSGRKIINRARFALIKSRIALMTTKGEIPKEGVFVYHVSRSGILFNEILTVKYATSVKQYGRSNHNIRNLSNCTAFGLYNSLFHESS